MVEAPGHTLGQLMGAALELAIRPVLQHFADAHGLYLDFGGPRPARPRTSKCTWVDDLGNSHDLDFVLERAGSATELGLPAGFIETAWRRYTKHSKAKAQEIQGALLPLLEKYAHLKPFAGAVVAGEWTKSALAQLQTSGFEVLHIPYDEIIAVFDEFGIDARANEGTPDPYLQAQVDRFRVLSADERERVGARLRATAPLAFAEFRRALEASILRKVTEVIVVPVYGTQMTFNGVGDAIDALRDFTPTSSDEFRRFEVMLRYDNGDSIDARFASAVDAVEFLETFGP